MIYKQVKQDITEYCDACCIKNAEISIKKGRHDEILPEDLFDNFFSATSISLRTFSNYDVRFFNCDVVYSQ